MQKTTQKCKNPQGSIVSFFSFHDESCITNQLMTDHLGNSEFCFSQILIVLGNIEILGKQNSLFSLRPVIKCLVYISA